jgi:hypothetical protein
VRERPDARAIARFDFVLEHYAKAPGRAWLSGLTTWGWSKGIGLAHAIYYQNPMNVSDADDVLTAGEAAGALRRGNIDLDHTTRIAAGMRYGGPSVGASKRRPLDPRLAHPSDFAWQLTERGRAFFDWWATQVTVTQEMCVTPAESKRTGS